MAKLISLDKVFKIKPCLRQEFTNMDKSAQEIAFVTRGKLNNGVVGYVKRIDNVEPHPENTISVSCGGCVMASFLQPQKYYISQEVRCLQPIWKLTESQLLYYCMCLENNKYRYNFGRQAGRSLGKLKIPHPDHLPAYVKDAVDKVKKSFAKLLNVKTTFDVRKWKAFVLKDLFTISGTQGITFDKIFTTGKGSYPYVTSQKTNNGVGGFFNFKTEKGNVLIIDSSVTGYCSYQSKDFSTGGHVQKLQPKFSLNKDLAVFLTTILNMEQYRFSYGRKASQERLINLQIKLPTTSHGKPDWRFIENYMKELVLNVRFSN
ncbi:MAG: restriction endonuclease subunit S [Rickettsiales bacterium]|nr:restriction endonuclease subunit S [Rickettsiales bacterium]